MSRMITIETRNGKRAYETVAERVKKFRATYPVDSGWQLLTEIEFPKDGLVLCRAKIVDPDGRLVATGTAEEVRGSSFINKTSAVENAETSAIGRALFAAGFGGGEFCSADELMAAIKRQEELMAAENRAKKVQTAAPESSDDQPAPPKPSRRREKEPVQTQITPEPFEEIRSLSPDEFGLSEDCGIEFIHEGNVIYAKDRKKGAAFSNKEILKNSGFSFDGYQRVWFKRTNASEGVA
jgi:hypothetical protein